MRILISHAYSAENKGDAALLGVLIKESQNQFPGADITVLTMDEITDNDTFDGVPLRHSFMYYTHRWSEHKIAWLAYGLTMMFCTVGYANVRKHLGFRLPLPRHWKETVDLYADADLVIAVGGGYMRTKRAIGSIYDFMLLLHPLALAKRLDTPSVLYTQSIGPIFRKIERKMLARTLNRDVLLSIIREDKSMQLLAEIGVSNIARSVDAGFLLHTDEKQSPRFELELPENRIIFGVTARKWLATEAQAAYERALAKALDYAILEHDAHIVFIPQVTSEFHDDDDRITNHAIFDAMSQQAHATELTENYDYQQIKSLYDQLDFLIGTRFHSVIFSLTSNVPAIAIEYEHKTSGIMEDLGLGEWVIKMDAVTATILEPKIDALVLQQDAYRKKLNAILPAYIKQAHDAIVMTADAYENNRAHDSAN